MNPDDHSRMHLWPVTLVQDRLSGHEQVNRELITLFSAYRAEHSPSSGAAFVSPDNFSVGIENPALDTLRRFIMDTVFDVSRELNQEYWRQFGLQDIRVDLTGMWFQICNDHAFHETHVHGNCSWSGVYYVQAGSASRDRDDRLPNGMANGVTQFYGPDIEHAAAGHGDWGNYYLTQNTFTSYPQDGVLVVFPSHLKHMAFPYKGDQDRIIVSFHAQVNATRPIEYRYGLSSDTG